MPRQFSIHDSTWGEIKIFAIREDEDGVWEKEFEPLRQSAETEALRGLFTRIPHNAYLDLKHGNTRPFFDLSPLPPNGCLIKASSDVKICQHRETCPSFDPNACSAELTPPPCYEATISDSQTVRTLTTRVFDLWRFGCYVLVIEPEL